MAIFIYLYIRRDRKISDINLISNMGKLVTPVILSMVWNLYSFYSQML